MAERLSNPEVRREGPEYEIEQLMWLNELVQEMEDVAQSKGAGIIDNGALDVLSNLACAMTRRQGLEFGRTLVRKLYERSDIRLEEAPHTDQWRRHAELARQVDREIFTMEHSQAVDPAGGASVQPFPPDAPAL